MRILSRGDDQWVYFPSTGRVRKIAAKSKKESVRGVGGKLEEKYSFEIIESGSKEWVLEGTPKKSDSVYSRILLTVDKSKYLVLKTEYYTEEEGHYKDLVMGKIKMLGGREVPTQMVMINHEKNSKTVIITYAAEYDIAIDEKYFNPTRFYK